MTLIDLPEAKGRLDFLVPHLNDSHKAAWSSWLTLVKESPAFALPLNHRTRANIFHNHVCTEVEQRVGDLAGVEITDALGFFAIKVGGDILLRFKYVGHGAPANVRTDQQKRLARQTWNEQMMLALTGDDSLTPPTLLTCGYVIDGDEIGRVEIRCDCKGKVSWSYDIYGGETVIAPQALPGQEDTAKPAKITRKVGAAEGKDAASANGAS